MINTELKFSFIRYILRRFCFSFLFLSAVLVTHATMPATTNGVPVPEVFSHVILCLYLLGTIGHDSKAIVDAAGIIVIPDQIGWVFFFPLMNLYVVGTT